MALVSKFLALGRGPVIASLFFAAALLFGGGGSPNPATELVVQLSFVAAALAWFWTPDLGSHCRRVPADPIVWMVIALVLFLPLAQLVPLPTTVWSSLPGRENQLAALELVGAADSWRTWSLAPARTTASLLAIIPALFALYATAALDQCVRVGRTTGDNSTDGSVARAAQNICAPAIGLNDCVAGQCQRARAIHLKVVL